MDQSEPAVTHDIRLDLDGPAKLFFGLSTPPLIQIEFSQRISGVGIPRKKGDGLAQFRLREFERVRIHVGEAKAQACLEII